MEGSSPVDDFLDRAGKVFTLAGDLGRAFSEERRQQRRVSQIDRRSWDRHAPKFQEFGEAILTLREAMQNPPNGLGHVVEQLLRANGIAGQIWDTMQQPHGRDEATYLEFFPQLNSLFEEGWRAVNEVTKARELANPFSFGKKPPPGNKTDIDTTPASPEPPRRAIESAARDIPHIMSNVKRGRDGAIEMVASHLAKHLQDAGHTLAAAHWGIHRSILAGRLAPGPIATSAPSGGKTVGGAMRYLGGRDDRRTVWSGGGTTPKNIPKGKPAPFDHFKVTATEPLWAWWHSIADERSGERESAADTARISSDSGSALQRLQAGETTETPTETRSVGSGAAEALPDSWSRMVHGAIEAARRAWFDGYAVIVAEINTVLVERGTGLQIAAEFPPTSRTLLECRRRLAQAFRDIPGEISKLPDADKDPWKPWSVGFINDQTNPAVSTGANFVNITGEEFAQIVEFLRQKPKEWPWQSNLVEPIEQDAIQAAQAFDAMLARIGSLQRQAGAAVPAVELVGPQPPNQFQWNKRSCEMPPLPWRLINALWPTKSVLEDDVFEAVWPGATRSESALKTAISRINTVFLEAKIPVMLSRKNGYVLLTIADNA